MSKPERSAQQREPLDLGGLVASLREWADKIEGDPSGIVAFFLRFAFAEAAMVEHVGAPGRTLLVEGAGGGQTWVFGDWVEDADADEGYEDDPCGCVTASFRSSATPSTRPKSPRFGRCRRRGSTFSTRRRGLLGDPQNPRSGAQRAVGRRSPVPGDSGQVCFSRSNPCLRASPMAGTRSRARGRCSASTGRRRSGIGSESPPSVPGSRTSLRSTRPACGGSLKRRPPAGSRPCRA